MDKDTKQDPDTSESPDKDLVDLSALEGFNFATNWSESKSGRSNVRDFSRSDRKPRGNQADRKDRRPFKPGNFHKSKGSTHDEQRRGTPGSSSDRRKPYGRPEIPKTIVEVSFYPEDIGFLAICKALRVSTITYELFDIARTILEKSERFYMVLRPVDEKPTDDAPSDSSLYTVEADGLPFLSESAAVVHSLANCLDHFFTKDTLEVEAPTGSFTSIQKCGITGELLGPPNYHRLKKIMAGHHASRLSSMPYAKFESRVESVKEEEVIAEWLEKMKIQTTYNLKPEFGEARQFEDGETARAFAKANLASKLVNEVKSAHVDGSLLTKIKDPLIKANLEYAWECQKRFPLETANLLRGRLRRQKFSLYKKGTKGVSFVCAVKRRFRELTENLSIPVQKLIEFIEENPKVSAKEIPLKFLGFATFPTEGETPTELTDDQQTKLKAYSLDFLWLLKEGYISEYSDGTVYAHPAVEAALVAKNKGPKKQKIVAEPAAEKSKKVAESQKQSEVVSSDEPAVEVSAETDVSKPDVAETGTEDSVQVSTEATSKPEVDASEAPIEEPVKPEPEAIANESEVSTGPTSKPEVDTSETSIEEPVKPESEAISNESEETEIVEPIEEVTKDEEDAKVEEVKASSEVVAETISEVEVSKDEDLTSTDGETEKKAEEIDPAKS